MKVCATCKVPRPLEEFYSNGYTPKGTKKYKAHCRYCYHAVKKAAKTSTIKDILQESGRLLACEICGYKNNLAALTFHHKNSEEKDFEISQGVTRSRESLRVEIAKCDLLCHNCHMEVHYPHLRIVEDDL